MNNKLLGMQEMLFQSMERLSKKNLTNEEIQLEVARCNALSGNATTIIKSINVGLRVLEISEKIGNTVNKINSELGIQNEE